MSGYNREAFLLHVVELLRDRGGLVGVLIGSGFPGAENLLPDSLWFGEMTGEMSVVIERAGRKSLDDEYTIPGFVRVVDQVDLDATRNRVGEILAELVELLADDPTTDFDNVFWCLPGLTESIAADTPDGAVGWGHIDLNVHARYFM